MMLEDLDDNIVDIITNKSILQNNSLMNQGHEALYDEFYNSNDQQHDLLSDPDSFKTPFKISSNEPGWQTSLSKTSLIKETWSQKENFQEEEEIKPDFQKIKKSLVIQYENSQSNSQNFVNLK